MKLGRKIMSVVLATSLVLTTAVPASAEKGYDTDNTEKWKGLKIITSEVPEPENKDIYFDTEKNIVCKPNVKFRLDAVVDSAWTVSPAGEGVTVDPSGLVIVSSSAAKDTTYTITATPENITTNGASASIKVKVPKDAVPAQAEDICYSDAMEIEGISELSADKKTITVNGTRILPIMTVISPSYIANQATTYVTDSDNPSIEVGYGDLYTKGISGTDNVINCTIGESTGTKPLNVKVVANPFKLSLTSEDVKIDTSESDPSATIAMDQRVVFDITENSEFALDDYGPTTVEGYEFKVSGDGVEQSGNQYFVYDESGENRIARISFKGYGSNMKAIVKTEKIPDDQIGKWKAQDAKIELSYKKTTDAEFSSKSVTLKFSMNNAKFNTVGLDFAKGGLIEDVDYAVYEETITYKDEEGKSITKDMPVYYFESNYTDGNGNIIDNPLCLAQYTFADGDFKSTVNSFNEDKDNEFDRTDPKYTINFKLSDIETVDKKKNKEIGINNEDVNNQSLLTYVDDEGVEHCDALLRKGIGYKLITVQYGQKFEYYVIRFVSRSNNIESSLSMVKNPNNGSPKYYDLSSETVHVRQGESVVPVYTDEFAETKTSTLTDPFLTYTVEEDCACAFTNGSGVYALSGSSYGKTLVTVQGKVNKLDRVSFVLFVNEDEYEYEEGSFGIDFQAALDQKLIDSSDVIDGKQDAVPVNIKVLLAGAGLPDITWQLDVKNDDDTFAALDSSVAEITPGEEAGSAFIKTKKGTNYKIYVRVFSGNELLASKSFTIGEIDATSISEVGEKLEDGQVAVVESTEPNAGVCETGKTFKLAPIKYVPSNATQLDGKLVWSSDTPEVATVDSEGTVTTWTTGTANIKVSYTVNGTEASMIYKLTVKQGDIPVTDISCNSELTLTRIGATENIEASVMPANATNKTLTYTITGEQGIVEVSSTGVVTAKKVGTTTICVASASTPSVNKTITVTVKGEADKPNTSSTPVPTVAPTVVPTGGATAAPTETPASENMKPAKAKITSIKNVKGKKAQVKFKKVKGAIVYQVVYSTKKNFKSAKKVKVTKTSCTLKKLKKGKTYYVKVRAYNSYGYGAYSAVKKVKIKK